MEQAGNNVLYNRKSMIIGIFMKAVAVIVSVYGMMLSQSGAMTFTYFTNLSNVVADVALGAFLIMDIILVCGNGEKNYKKNWMYVIKFMATISITLTFLVYMFILAPTNENGVLYAYFHNHGASFCVHFLTPVLAVADFFLYDYDYKSTRKHALYAIIPPLAYVGYVVVAGRLGVRWGDGMMAPYNFLNYGAATGWFGFDMSVADSTTLGIGVAYMIIVLVIIFLGLGQMYLKLKDMRQRAVYRQK